MTSKTKRSRKRKSKRQGLWLGIALAGALGLIAWVFFGGYGYQLTASGAKLVHTMDPNYFSKDPKARAAYQVAKDMPEVLAELPCFCGCMTAMGHESNLFCFRDEHGSGCNICEDIALEARDMHDKGLSIDRIKQAIREHFAH
jgi:hypothetical protein